MVEILTALQVVLMEGLALMMNEPAVLQKKLMEGLVVKLMQGP